MTTQYLLKNAEIVWNEETPISAQYRDIYWQKNAAIKEKYHVFIKPFKELSEKMPIKSQITVCELGLGFGKREASLILRMSWLPSGSL